MAPPLISLVLPVYNERDNLKPLLLEIQEAMAALPDRPSYEIIAVDDGSRDGSFEVLRDLIGSIRELKVLVFAHQTGQAAAFDAGFRQAQGTYVITMDADGQSDPRDIASLWATIQKGYDVVSGWRTSRQDPFLRRACSQIANAIIRKLIRTSVHDLGCSLRIYRRDILTDIHLYGEMHRLLCPLLEMLGARTMEIPVSHRRRQAGESKYGFNRTFKILLDVIHLWFQGNYQTKPLYIFGGFGLTFAFAGTLTCLYTLYDKWEHGVYVHRNPLMLIGISMGMIGILFLGMGLLAELLVRTYFESQGKTAYRIRQRLESK